MAILSFTLSPEATGRVHELLICLAKFGESVSIEARSEKLTLTALNLSRTAYASFALDTKSFFLSYDFQAPSSTQSGDRFTCQLYNKALQSVFKGRAAAGGREATVDRCDVTIRDEPDKAECRLVIKMFCKHGMTKTYHLTYESVEVMHALFDRTAATQGWRISSRMMREYVEYFGPKTEQLDILAQDGKVIFTSFTEKIQDGKEVLKQPLETAITLHTEDFDDFHMQEKMHIVVSVKDFKAIITHAETLHGSISAYFSYPTRPLQFSYQSGGIHCEFTLMTSGDYRGASATPNPNFVSTRSESRAPSMAPQHPSRSASEMPPPPLPPMARQNTENSFSSISQRLPRGPPSHQPSVSEPEPEPDPEESLFMPGGDEDQTWDPPDYEQEGEEEMLGWDASNSLRNAGPQATFRDSGRVAVPPGKQPQAQTYESQDGLEPTQRLSQLHGMFD